MPERGPEPSGAGAVGAPVRGAPGARGPSSARLRRLTLTSAGRARKKPSRSSAALSRLGAVVRAVILATPLGGFARSCARAWRRSRLWRFISSTHPAAVIRQTLSLRLALVITATTLGLVLVFGFVVSAQMRPSVFDSRRAQIPGDASVRFSSVQSVLGQCTARTVDQSQEMVRSTRSSRRASAAGAGAINVALLRSPSAPESFRINQIGDQQMEAVIDAPIRQAVRGGGAAQWQSVAIASTDGDAPGILVGMSVQVPKAGGHELYILYSLESDQRQITMVTRTLFVTALPILVLMPIGVFWVLHRMLAPVRKTAQAATDAALGDLSVRVEVVGDDEMADLGYAFNDMTASLQHTIDEYDELSRLQQRFVSDVSHELRTPLTTIRMAEDVIWHNRASLPSGAKRSAELLHEQTERMDSMLADLLEISRYDAQSALLDPEVRDLRPLVRKVVDANRDLAERQGVRVVVDAPAARCAAEIDERRIERVLRNLVVNAIEHADGSDVVITIAQSGTEVAVRVRDGGVGMDEETAAHVFDRFYRADTARARTTGGTGLGLAIATEDTQIHGGQLEAHGVPGEGASFLLTLPKTAGDPLVTRPLKLWEGA